MLRPFNRQQASPDTPGAGHLGWVMYDPHSGQLLDNSADELHPLQLTFNSQYGRQYRQCLQVGRFNPLDEICHSAQAKAEVLMAKTAAPAATFLVKSKRLYFYDSPDKSCQDENGKFIVSGDSVTAEHRQTYQQFLFVRYIHPKTGDKTEGWVKADGLTVQSGSSS